MFRCAETSLRERAHPDLPGGPDPGVLQHPGGEMRSGLEGSLRRGAAAGEDKGTGQTGLQTCLST